MNRQCVLLFVFLSLLASACGPVRSTVGLIRADQALAEAREINAAEHAAYAMTLAEALRDKAWEEQGYAQYDTSMNLAQEAETLAREAIQVTRAAVAPLPPPVADADLFGDEEDSETETAPVAGEAPPAESAPDEGEAPAEPAASEGEAPAEETSPQEEDPS
jgi:hypothetical protein